MADDGKPLAGAGTATEARRVGALATQALNVVAARGERHLRSSDPALLQYLIKAVLAPARPPAATILARFGRAGVRAEDVADIYVPAAARQLGADWCDDRLSFADVTIGSSRLQTLLRDLGPEWRADSGQVNGHGAALLVLVADAADHTLGASVLAGRLRRMGYSVRLQVGGEGAALTELVRDCRFDAVFLSASPAENFDALRRLVDCIRVAGAASPIVVGGSIVGQGEECASMLLAETGADHVTCDLDEALTFCRLTTVPDEAAPPAPGA